MAQQIANGKQQFIDGNGAPLAGGSVAFYSPGTLNPVNTWQDSGLTVLNANPVTLDANGMASIWGVGSTQYRQIVKDVLGNTVWDQVVGLIDSYQLSATGAVVRPVPAKLAESVSVLDFGADPTGVADSTAAIQAAIATGKPLLTPEGTYLVSGTLSFTNSVFGFNASKTILKSNNLTAPVATLSGTNNIVRGITFQHTLAPAQGSGADGLVLLAGCYQASIQDCVANYNDNGFHVAPGSSALWFERANGSNNASHGFLFYNPNYFIHACIADQNGKDGYNFQTTAEGAGTTMSDCLSYGNANNGYTFQGSATNIIADVFLSNNIASYNAGNGFYFDCYGPNIQASNCYSEYCGYDTSNSIVSNGSVGYTFTANNPSASLANCNAYHNTSDGLYAASVIELLGGKYTQNGQGTGGGCGVQDGGSGFITATNVDLSGNVTGSQSTVAGQGSFYNCPGLNQAAFLTAPALPISGYGLLNPYNIPVTVYLDSNGFSQVQVKIAGTISPALYAQAGVSINLPPGATIIPTYTGTPTWVWTPN